MHTLACKSGPRGPGIKWYNTNSLVRTNCITSGILALPAQLKKDGYANPANGKDCAFQRGFRTDLHFFEFMKENPEAASQFNNHMSVYHQGRPSWMDVGFYDVPSLFSNVAQDDVLLVDVGGSMGHDLSEFRRKWSDAPGRLILQDLPDVVAQAKSGQLHPSIEAMEHDFFTEQPIKGIVSSSIAPLLTYINVNIFFYRCSCLLYALCPPRLDRR